MQTYVNISIEDLLLNTNNARFIDPDNIFEQEEDVLVYMANNKQFHIVKLAEDIAVNGLNATEIPIVLPHHTIPNKYNVMDGNRRITSIKLMTQYKSKLEEIGIKKSIAIKIKPLEFSQKSIQCVVGSSEEEVDLLLEKIHTAPEGISRLQWDAQARDKHQLKKSNMVTHRYAVISMLRYSSMTPFEIKEALKTSRWVSKLGRILRNKEIRRFLGIDFRHGSSDVILYLEEEEVIKGLSQVIYDLAIDERKYPSSQFFQTLENQSNYLKQFPTNKKPDVKKTVTRSTCFNISNNTFEYGEEIKDPNYCLDTASNISSDDFGDTAKHAKPTIDSTITTDKISSNHFLQAQELYSRKLITLIPREDYINITNPRTAALYRDLQNINIVYINAISIVFRSLVEFSINALFERCKNKLFNNRHETLENKLEKAISILESKHGKDELLYKFPSIYAAVGSYKSSMRIDSIPVLNILVHNYNYHPTSKELVQIYNNYKPFLETLWNYINNLEK
ncbi:MAG: hypothetical protein P4N59_24805 [Negativicutes bacterium]|nr:hypothetical protein [Negativicutes bacterium]